MKQPKQPWSKFFWSDYDSDEGLRICTLAAQGLWMRMLCIMARAVPVGELRIAGSQCTVAEIAKAVSEREEIVTTLLHELEQHGVFSKTRSGLIFCRRMRKEAAKSLKMARNGSGGGRVTQLKNKELRDLLKQNVEQKSSPRGHSFALPQEKEERGVLRTLVDLPEKSEPKIQKLPKPAESSAAVNAQADRFYAAYPKRVDPHDARKKFIAAVKSGVDPERIIAAAARFAEAHRLAGTDKKYIPGPAVWINRGSYDSEDLPSPASCPSQPVTPQTNSAGGQNVPQNRSTAWHARQNYERNLAAERAESARESGPMLTLVSF